MPKRVNKAIELLADDLPVFYTGSHTGAELNYDAGRAMSKTWADYINVGMEHGSFDLSGLAVSCVASPMAVPPIADTKPQLLLLNYQ